MAKFKFKILRYNPETDAKPVFKSYSITLPDGGTVLDGLLKIKAEKDPTLAFRRSCRSAICGSCAARVNGKAMLICDLQAADAAKNGEIILEPLANFDVIKDIVVDLTPFFNAVEKSLPWVVPQPEIAKSDRGCKVAPGDDFVGLGKVDVCVLCAACHSDCTALAKRRDFPGPIFNLKTARAILDSRDSDTGRAARAVNFGLDVCEAADKCPVDCPKSVDFPEHVYKPIRKAFEKNRAK